MCPKYTNSTSDLIVAGSKRFEPNQTLSFVEWLDPLPTGITKDSDSPYFDPVVYSAQITTTTTVSVPTGIGGSYMISIYCQSGTATVKLNSSSATARYLGAGDSYSVKCMDRIVDNVIITITTATVNITIEKI